MTTLREAAQQALEQLKINRTNFRKGPSKSICKMLAGGNDEVILALEAALAEPVQECPHGVTDGNCKECYGKATNSEPFTVYTTLRQREWPALWTGCPNCASLQDQNTELDRKLADLEQTSLELCKACGWRTVIPGEGCLNCARSKLAELERKPLTEEEIKHLLFESAGMTVTFSAVDLSLARAIERAHGIGGSDD